MEVYALVPSFLIQFYLDIYICRQIVQAGG